jgi:hypothetical protein
MMNALERAKLQSVLKAEFARHRWDTFVDEPPSMAQGGHGVVVPGCSMCRVPLQTVNQFTDHLAAKVWEAIERET